MMRTVIIRANLKFNAQVRTSLDNPVEVSLDCPACARTGRTVLLTATERAEVRTPQGQVVALSDDKFPAVCTPSLHPFPARVARDKPESASSSGLTVRLVYGFSPFVDLKYGEQASGLPAWCRVNFRVTCPRCKTERRRSTQTNLVRPCTERCECGYELYTDDEPPEIKEVVNLSENAT